MSLSSKHELLNELKHQILTLALRPGEMIDEKELSVAFGVSRTPLRETIQRLSGEGYLELSQNRGAKVASMDLETMRQFFQAAPMVYAAISRLAAERAEMSEIAKLKTIQKTYCEALKEKDASAAALCNHAFHAQIGDMAHSPYLLPSLNRLLIDHTRVAQRFYRAKNDDNVARIVKAADQHDALIAAFERQAPSEAVDITLQHWELSRDQMEKFVRPDPLPFDMMENADAV